MTHNPDAAKFFCSICDKRFPQKVNYVNHMNQVHEQPGTCPVQGCPTRFKSDASFYKHFEEVHSEIDGTGVKVFVKFGGRSYRYANASVLMRILIFCCCLIRFLIIFVFV